MSVEDQIRSSVVVVSGDFTECLRRQAKHITSMYLVSSRRCWSIQQHCRYCCFTVGRLTLRLSSVAMACKTDMTRRRIGVYTYPVRTGAGLFLRRGASSFHPRKLFAVLQH